MLPKLRRPSHKEWLDGFQAPERGLIFDAVFAPPVLRDVIVRGLWRAIVLPVPKLRGGCSVSPLFELEPPTAPVPEIAAEVPDPDPICPIASRTPAGMGEFSLRALQMSQSIYRWAPDILQADPSQRDQLEKMLSWFHSCVVKMTPTGLLQAGHMWGHHVFESAYLLKCMMLSRVLRGTSKLSYAIKRSVALVLPKEISDHVERILDEGAVKLPSRSTLSRFNLTLDAAFMLYQRRRLTQTQTGAANTNIRYLHFLVKVAHSSRLALRSKVDAQKLTENNALGSQGHRVTRPNPNKQIDKQAARLVATPFCMVE